MRTNRKAQPTPDEALAYRQDALKTIIGERGIAKNNVMRLFGQSNPATVNKWVEGKPMYIDCFVKILNSYDIDLLSFFSYRGHKFNITIEQLAEMEEKHLLDPLYEQLGYPMPEFQGIETPSDKPDAEQPRPDMVLVEAQQQIISSQRQLIDDLRIQIDALKSQLPYEKHRMVADTSKPDPKPYV